MADDSPAEAGKTPPSADAIVRQAIANNACAVELLDSATNGRYSAWRAAESAGNPMQSAREPQLFRGDLTGWMVAALLALGVCLLAAAGINAAYERPLVNGASVYNRLSLVALAATVLTQGPAATGTLVAALVVPWLIAASLSRRFKKKNDSVAQAE
jgi:hypothetical protein